MKKRGLWFREAANILCWSRIAVGVFVAFGATRGLLPAILYSAAFISDVWDGWFYRQLGEEERPRHWFNRLPITMDPIADCILVCGGIIYLSASKLTGVVAAGSIMTVLILWHVVGYFASERIYILMMWVLTYGWFGLMVVTVVAVWRASPMSGWPATLTPFWLIASVVTLAIFYACWFKLARKKRVIQRNGGGKTMSPIMTALLVILCVNCLSFTLYRVIRQSSPEGLTATMVRKTVPGHGMTAAKKMAYFVAGNLNQPLAAFQFLDSGLVGDATYMQFGQSGWRARATAAQILRDVHEHGYSEVEIYTISLGDHVARYVEAGWDDSLGSLRVIAINPCPMLGAVKQPLRSLFCVAPLFEGVCYAMGWLSVVPVIPTVGGNYSLMLLADQYWEIALDQAPHEIRHTVGVVCSRAADATSDEDGILTNVALRDYYRGVKIVTIATGHGDTVGQATKYRDGVRELLRA